ncbi:MAG TPA: flavodoxin domain-containing protein [Kofleriaceae bacterium]|jgi:menaquinone-dependent protoporphyrinogen oxidase|nr:flavodoxin domain-containing protein [Kofleriaceae bacterium]
MKILIVHASSYGTTRAIAERIADRLRARGHAVELTDALGTGAAVAPPSGYDAVLIGSRIQLGKHAKEIVAYVKRHKLELLERPSAFFSVSMAAATSADADPNGYLAAFFAETGWRPSGAIAFGGSLDYRAYGFVTRLIMKMISKRAGHATDTSKDHHYTDWAAVDRFADALFAAPTVGPTVGSSPTAAGSDRHSIR